MGAWGENLGLTHPRNTSLRTRTSRNPVEICEGDLIKKGEGRKGGEGDILVVTRTGQLSEENWNIC